jgi:poly-gamma-glutamate synthesis protein (capsule biosynthesis protein)
MDDFRGRFRSYGGGTDGFRAPKPQPKPTQRPKPATARPTPKVQPDEDFLSIQKPSKKRKSKKKSGRGKKTIISLVAILMVGAGGFFGWRWYANYKDQNSKDAFSLGDGPKNENTDAEKLRQTQEQPAAESVATGKIRIMAGGDNIPMSAILERAKAGSQYNFDKMFAGIKPVMEKADITMCQQPTPSGGEASGFSGHPVYNAPSSWATALNTAGCTVVDLASNHTNDKGQKAIDATISNWEKQPEMKAVVGAQRSQKELDELEVYAVKNINFASLSYTTSSNKSPEKPYSVSIYSDALAKKQIAEARKKADIVTVHINWGTEYETGVTSAQNKTAQKLADFGADIVIGHGSHTLQPVKVLSGSDGRSTIVWFGLGNMLNAQLEIEALIGGFAVMDVDIATKKVSVLGFLPTYSHYEWTAAQKSANDLLARKNFGVHPLDASASLLTKSLNSTNVSAQTARVKSIMNTHQKTAILTTDKL